MAYPRKSDADKAPTSKQLLAKAAVDRKPFVVNITVRVEAADQKTAETRVSDLLFGQSWVTRVRTEAKAA